MDKPNKQKIVVILGPTACGKTALSLDIAKRFNGEIISGDSMQVYRHMNIGTAKISQSEMQDISHHMLDILEPDQQFNVADFRSLSEQIISQIAGRGHLPMVVGGTGLYINSLLTPYHFNEIASSDPKLRMKLQARLDLEGNKFMHQELQKVDSKAAEKIHPNDTHRLLRALEVYYLHGKPMSELQQASLPESVYDALLIGLNMDRQLLYRRIEERVDLMIAAGLEKEVKSLLDEGIPREAQSMQGLGYRQIVAYLNDEITREEAIEMLKRDTRRFAKRQLTWFSRYTDINWFYPDRYREGKLLTEDVCALIAQWLKEGEYYDQRSAGKISQ